MGLFITYMVFCSHSCGYEAQGGGQHHALSLCVDVDKISEDVGKSNVK
jgi:hypothetical protein